MEITKQIIKDTERLLDKTNVFNQITTRAADPNARSLVEFHTFTDDKLQRIADAMPEINRATRCLGRSKTQTTNKLMTLTMLADASPYRALVQCLAQVEHKRKAVKENRFKLLKDRVQLGKLEIRFANERDPYESELIEIEIERLASTMSDTMLYIEGALKSIASFQSSYTQICKNKGIPENWDEMDLEKAEVGHHLRMAFLHAYRDVMAHGRLGMGTLEYLQQFGVHPHKAAAIVQGYIKVSQGNLKTVDYEDLEVFLDGCVEQFKDAYKQVLKRIGIDNLYESWYMYQEDEDGLHS